MLDAEKAIERLEYAWEYIRERPNPVAGPKAFAMDGIRKSIELLKEQESEIRQLRLALDIAKGTCKGIRV